MNSKFTQKAQNALNAALSAACLFGHTYVGSEHLLLGIAQEKDSAAARILYSRGAAPEKLREKILAISGNGNESRISASDMTPCVKKIIEESAHLSAKYNQSYIGTEHLLAALIEEVDSVGVRVLELCSVSVGDLRGDLATFLGGAVEKAKSANAKKQNSHTSALSGFGRDLTEMARQGMLDPTVGRDRETNRVIRILSRRSKNNPCLIGEPGVGKTAVIEGLAQKIADGNVPETLYEKKIIVLDIPSMIAGAKYRGEFEDRMKNVMNEVSRNRDVILFIDEIHTIVGAGAAEGAVDAANIIKPALARGEIRIIGATTVDEYRKYIEKDAALERRFQPITVEEPSADDAVEILRGIRDTYEAHHRLKISDEAIEAAVSLSKRYIPDRYLPDKAIDLIDETAARMRISTYTAPSELKISRDELAKLKRSKEEAIIAQDFERAAQLRDQEKKLRESYENSKCDWERDQSNKNMTVTAADIAETVSDQTGIPIGQKENGDASKLIDLERQLKERVVGQDKAIDEIAAAVRRGRAGLADPKKPTGSFIFLGPTGVGKTELSVALAEAVYGDSSTLIRLDMSEYMEKHSVSKLIGSPPGYIGYGEGGKLTEKVRRHPYSLVLFDEIEKAHPDIFNLLLQILDDGKLTDSQGRAVNFRNTIIIMTSNLGSGGTEARLGFFEGAKEGDKEKVLAALKQAFRPEFINRVDNIIVFDKLGTEALENITKLHLQKLIDRCRELGISLELDPSAVALIASEGKDERYGARPIRRAVTRLAEDPLSLLLLEGRVKSGDKIIGKAEENKIIFEHKKG
ncbi:MAG: ATP-dependent Clp protease ATP-binding subunit [Clostridia bacterium]|nr:ATP-dependent Clp protease ATP-binding subunit [Clostridia bacterium]